MSEIRVDSITDEVGTSSPDFPNGILKSSMPSGSVIQVVSTTKTDTFSAQSSGGSFNTITGLNVLITPTSATSKIFIIANVAAGSDTGNRHAIRLLRNSSPICIGDSAGSRTPSSGAAMGVRTHVDTMPHVATFLDSPNTTSATTYLIQGSAEGSQTFFCNRPENNLNDDSIYSPTSSITVMEIAG